MVIPMADVLALPVRYLAEMPIACTLTLAIEGAKPEEHIDLLLTTSRTRAHQAAALSEVCCTPLEYEALAVALELEAITAQEVRPLLRRKRGPLGYTLTIEALVGATTRLDGRTSVCRATRRPHLRIPPARRMTTTWTLGQLAHALGARLTSVEMQPAQTEAAAWPPRSQPAPACAPFSARTHPSPSEARWPHRGS